MEELNATGYRTYAPINPEVAEVRFLVVLTEVRVVLRVGRPRVRSSV